MGQPVEEMVHLKLAVEVEAEAEEMKILLEALVALEAVEL
jgi:hypothetical protein